MWRSFTVLMAVTLWLGGMSSCKDGKSGGPPGKGQMAPPQMRSQPMGNDSMHGETRPDPRPKAPPPLSTGPTGIRECDLLLKMLDRCHKKHASLQIAYKTVLKDAPGWKAKALKRDPKQIDELAKACARTAKEVGESFDCN